MLEDPFAVVLVASAVTAAATAAGCMAMARARPTSEERDAEICHAALRAVLVDSIADRVTRSEGVNAAGE